MRPTITARVHGIALCWSIGFLLGTAVFYAARAIGPVTFSPFQLIVSFVVVLLFNWLALAIGIAEGRAREACESTQEIADDDGGGLGARVRRRH